MAHYENLKILAITSDNAETQHTALAYFTDKGYPKVVSGDMISQIQHLEQAGQHRIIVSGLDGLVTYEQLKNEFHDTLELIGITHSGTQKQTDLIETADHYIGASEKEPLPEQLDALVEKLEFTL